MDLNAIITSGIISLIISGLGIYISWTNNIKKHKIDVYDRILPVFIEMKKELHSLTLPSINEKDKNVALLVQEIENAFLYKNKAFDKYLLNRPFFPKESQHRIEEAEQKNNKFEQLLKSFLESTKQKTDMDVNELEVSLKDFYSYLGKDCFNEYQELPIESKFVFLRSDINHNVGRVIYREIDNVIQRFYGDLL